MISSRFAADVPAPVLAQHLAQVSAVVCIALALASGGVALPASPRAWLPVVGIAVVSTVIALFTFLAGMALDRPDAGLGAELARGDRDALDRLRAARRAARSTPVGRRGADPGGRGLAERGRAAGAASAARAAEG